MPSRLWLRAIASFKNGLGHGVGEPFIFKVEGLAYDMEAWIAQYGEPWKLLRSMDGEPGEWKGEYDSAEEVLQLLQNEVDAEGRR